MLFLCLLDTTTHFSLSRSQVWEPLEQTFYGPFCFMVDNGVITGLSRRELKLLFTFDRRGNIYCSTLCSEYSHPSGSSQSSRNTPVTRGQVAGLSLPCPPVSPWHISECWKVPWRKHEPQCVEQIVLANIRSSAWCPPSRGSGRGSQLHEKSMCAVSECSHRGSVAVAGQWLHQSVFNDGSGPNSASHESLLSYIQNL